MAASHLLELGHRYIGVISGLTSHNDRARSRIDGVRKSLTQAGLSLPPTLVTEQAFNLEGGRLGLRKLMASRQKPSAIFCGNDLLAVGAMLEAERMGLDVPSDLSICGIDNLEISEAINPGLTTVSLPTQDLGRIGPNTCCLLFPARSSLPSLCCRSNWWFAAAPDCHAANASELECLPFEPPLLRMKF